MRLRTSWSERCKPYAQAASKIIVCQFGELCEKKGFVRQLTMPYTPQQTDVAERRNRTLKDIVRSMWRRDLLRDALLKAAYLLNQVPCKSVELDPYNLLDYERAQS